METPEDLGIPKWSGSPEEAAKIIRAAMRHFGAATVTFHELTDDTRKFIYSHDPDGKELIFTDEEEAYETEEARYVPNKCKYVITYSVQMSLETLRRSPTHTACQTTLGCYGRSRRIQGLTQEFLRGLGYQGLGEASINALGIAPAFAVLSGMGELGRFNRVITPEHGPMVRIFKNFSPTYPWQPINPLMPVFSSFARIVKNVRKPALQVQSVSKMNPPGKPVADGMFQATRPGLKIRSAA